MRRLIVNVDHVATLRQARAGVEPDPVAAAAVALLGGADGIVVHLREDRRHIQDRDLRLLRQTLHDRLVLEMAATHEMQKIALEVRPDSVTLVPERRAELTTEGGLDVLTQVAALGDVVRALGDAGIRSCLFVAPDLEQVKAAHRLGAKAVEIHAGNYADARRQPSAELERLRDAARFASKLGLEVGVGHGLHYRNVAAVALIEEFEEFSIGHAILARALLVGLERAVADMKRLVA